MLAAGNVEDDKTLLVRGSDSRLLSGFHRKYLSRARVYRRAVAFFSSSIFESAMDEFSQFFRAGGTMELICSPVFNVHDLELLHQSIYHAHRSPRSLDLVLLDQSKSRPQNFFSWVVSNRRLSIRIAIVNSQTPYSIYHEKIGVALFRDGSFVAIEGSANESAFAFRHNFERILVHQSEPKRPHVWANTIFQNFEQLWNNQTYGVEIISLHNAFVRQLLVGRMSAPSDQFSAAPRQRGPISMRAPAEIVQHPPRLELRAYQVQAIENWFANGGQGIYSMATGSGKTITALSTIEQLYKRVGPPLVVIIVAPYLNLVDQWIEEGRTFGLNPINCSGSSRDWTSLVDTALYMNQKKERPILSLVTTNSTFSLEPFQRVLDNLQVRTILVADEVHNLGARHLTKKLPERVNLRLGLSATPERWMDEDGTQAIKDYFGKVVFNFDLSEALSGDSPALCPYTYYPIIVNLDDDETEEYMLITTQLARLMDDPRAESFSDVALALLLKRARLIACAKEKLPAFRQAIYPYRNTRFNLVYCGDGRVEIESASSSAASSVPESDVVRQVDAIIRILGNDIGMNVAKYTAETTKEVRRQILADFASGEKQALVAIRCLDEGVDIPQVRRAFILASSTNPRQFIQRRGRVLRRAEGKEEAEIFDFVVSPPLDGFSKDSAEFKTLRKLVAREMARVIEFARLAQNGPQATGRLRPVLSKLQLLHL